LKQFTSLLAQWAGDKRVVAGAAIAGVVIVGTLLYRWRNRPPSPEELERQRRLHVNHVGRIAEGRVIDVVKRDEPVTAGRKKKSAVPETTTRQMIHYSYSISGVTYETAQDVTGLEGRVQAYRVIVGQPASVKYDPSNPSNSILVADDWSGLH
jgi:hypothetical protein